MQNVAAVHVIQFYIRYNNTRVLTNESKWASVWFVYRLRMTEYWFCDIFSSIFGLLINNGNRVFNKTKEIKKTGHENILCVYIITDCTIPLDQFYKLPKIDWEFIKRVINQQFTFLLLFCKFFNVTQFVLHEYEHIYYFFSTVD